MSFTIHTLIFSIQHMYIALHINMLMWWLNQLGSKLAYTKLNSKECVLLWIAPRAEYQSLTIPSSCFNNFNPTEIMCQCYTSYFFLSKVEISFPLPMCILQILWRQTNGRMTRRNLKSWWRHQKETFPAVLAIYAHIGQWRGALIFSLICAE